jgi:hypothetical protein
MDVVMGSLEPQRAAEPFIRALRAMPWDTAAPAAAPRARLAAHM